MPPGLSTRASVMDGVQSMMVPLLSRRRTSKETLVSETSRRRCQFMRLHLFALVARVIGFPVLFEVNTNLEREGIYRI